MSVERQAEVERDLEGAFDDFELISGRGSAPVYAATEVAFGRRVAIKVLRNAGKVPVELLAQAQLSWHPNVLTLLGAHESPSGTTYTVLELADGSLQDHIDRGDRLPVGRLLRLGEELSSAIAATHEAGVFHCDIKPSNVLVAHDGSARLADFGISKWSDATLDTMESMQGSLRYVPPELFDGSPLAASNDVYALALTLYAAATGLDPFGPSGQTQPAIISRIHTEVVEFGALDAGFDPTLVELLDRAVAKDPTDRPTAADLHRAFSTALSSVPPASRTTGDAGPTAPAPGRFGTARQRLVVTGIVVAAGLLGAAIASVVTDGDTSSSPTTTVSAASADAAYCATFERSVRARIELFETISSDLEQSTSPTEVIRRLLVSYPAEFSQVMRPLLDANAQLDGGDAPSVGDDQVAELALADSFRSLTGGKLFLFDGESGEFNPRNLPSELRESARHISDLYIDARERCPDVQVGLAPSKARMSSAIYANLKNSTFISGFFSDPESDDIVGPRVVALMFSMARGFFEDLFAANWRWFVEMLDGHPDIRATVAYDHPDLILEALDAMPDLVTIVDTDDWRDDLQLGLKRLDPAAKVGVGSLYSDELTAVGAIIP